MKTTRRESQLDTEWYSWAPPRWRLFGNLKYHLLASIVYLTVSLFPLILYGMQDTWLVKIWPLRLLPCAMTHDIVDWAKDHPHYVVPWAIFVALIYPLWQWQEVRAFDRWCKGKPKDDVVAIRQEFDRYTKLAENFWKAVWAIYTAAGLLGIAFKSNDGPGSPSQKSSQAPRAHAHERAGDGAVVPSFHP